MCINYHTVKCLGLSSTTILAEYQQRCVPHCARSPLKCLLLYLQYFGCTKHLLTAKAGDFAAPCKTGVFCGYEPSCCLHDCLHQSCVLSHSHLHAAASRLVYKALPCQFCMPPLPWSASQKLFPKGSPHTMPSCLLPSHTLHLHKLCTASPWLPWIFLLPYPLKQKQMGQK